MKDQNEDAGERQDSIVTRQRGRYVSPHFSTAAAAAALGISVAQFIRLAAKLGIEHDDTYPNPHYKSGPPAKLWSKAGIAAMKRRKAVEQFLLGAATRSDAANSAVRTRRERLLAECDVWEPTVRRIALSEVVDRAVSSYNDYGYSLLIERARSREPADRSSSPDFLFRITRNYIRHHLTDYEDKLAAIRGLVGTQDAYADSLRPTAESAIDAIYPELAGYLAVIADGHPARNEMRPCG